MIDADIIAQRLRDLRGEQKREEVADACGISLSALTMYETGQRVPRDEIKVKLARFYGSNVEDIFFCRDLSRYETTRASRGGRARARASGAGGARRVRCERRRREDE